MTKSPSLSAGALPDGIFVKVGAPGPSTGRVGGMGRGGVAGVGGVAVAGAGVDGVCAARAPTRKTEARTLTMSRMIPPVRWGAILHREGRGSLSSIGRKGRVDQALQSWNPNRIV